MTAADAQLDLPLNSAAPRVAEEDVLILLRILGAGDWLTADNICRRWWEIFGKGITDRRIRAIAAASDGRVDLVLVIIKPAEFGLDNDADGFEANVRAVKFTQGKVWYTVWRADYGTIHDLDSRLVHPRCDGGTGRHDFGDDRGPDPRDPADWWKDQ